LLIVSVAVVGVPHTIVPDHWAPITLIVRQRGWSKGETACAALQAGIGHVVSTLIIASVIWFAGVAVAVRIRRRPQVIGFQDFESDRLRCSLINSTSVSMPKSVNAMTWSSPVP
jgi:hypothetical protein